MEENRQTKRETLMAEAPIPGLILKMAVPTIVAFLINSIYSLTDTYFAVSYTHLTLPTILLV